MHACTKLLYVGKIALGWDRKIVGRGLIISLFPSFMFFLKIKSQQTEGGGVWRALMYIYVYIVNMKPEDWILKHKVLSSNTDRDGQRCKEK